MRFRMKIGATVAALGAAVTLASASSSSASAETGVEQGEVHTAAGQCPYSGGHPQVSEGRSYSSAVKHAQCLWNVQNKKSGGKNQITEDGYFGPATKTAMWQIQGACGLKADGIVGPKTWKCLHLDQSPNPGDGAGVWPIPPRR